MEPHACQLSSVRKERLSLGDKALIENKFTQADITVSEIAKRSGDTVNTTVFVDHAVHDVLNESLIHVCAVQVP